MFKTILEITYDNNVLDKNSIRLLFGWQRRDIIVLLINRYISEQKLRIISLKDLNSYEIVWSSQEDFENFLLEKNYIDLINFLKGQLVEIGWHF
jgi:hypothetical protein